MYSLLTKAFKHKKTMKHLLLTLGLFILAGCTSVPITGRSQLSLVDASTVQMMAVEGYQEQINTYRISNNQQETQRLRKVGERIINATESYLRSNGYTDVLRGFDWEINLLQSEQVNAFCMPGGKIAFYEGIMPLCSTDDYLATVMSHEIAHAIAQHGRERISQGLAQNFGGAALQIALSNEPRETQEMAMLAFGLGSSLGLMLPFSRKHEAEADELGLYFMTMAGYDPYQAANFWKVMAENAGGASTPEFFSTHPSPQSRIQNLQQLAPLAVEKFGR